MDIAAFGLRMVNGLREGAGSSFQVGEHAVVSVAAQLIEL
jgi:hypothetical protein